jgi:hypothetical protein
MSQLASIQELNTQIAQLNQLLNELRAICPSDDTAVVTVPDNVQEDLKEAGIAIDTTQDITGNDVKTWMKETESQIDSLNSSQQLLMIQLQSEMNKQNEANQLLSDQLKKQQDEINAVMNNMR